MKSRSTPKMDNLNKGKPIKEHVGQRLLWCEGGNIYGLRRVRYTQKKGMRPRLEKILGGTLAKGKKGKEEEEIGN